MEYLWVDEFTGYNPKQVIDFLNSDLDYKVRALYRQFLVEDWDPTIRCIHSVEDLRTMIDKIAGERIHDVFIGIGGIKLPPLVITLVLQQKNWHWKHMVVHLLYKYLPELLPITTRFHVNCRNAVTWEKWESILMP